MEYVYDILNVNKGIIAHQVNCKGVMNAGVAKQIRESYPLVFEKYKEYIPDMQPGMIQLIQVKEDLYICNLAGQNDYKGEQNTDYQAVKTAFQKLFKVAQEKDLPVYIPYMMGCGLAGGDWTKYRGIIKDACPTVQICCLHFKDLDIFTTCFSKIKSVPKDITPVSIARYAPKNLKGHIASYPGLFPSQQLLSNYKSGKINQTEYKNIYYRETLMQVNTEQVLEHLKSFGNKVALVCYERADDFCHRFIVKDWINYLTGYSPKELSSNYRS